MAFQVLEQVVSPLVHDRMVKLIKSQNQIADAIPVLCKNYRGQDEAILFEAIQKLPVTCNGSFNGGWHGCFSAVEKLFNDRRFKPRTNMLTYIYNKTLCSSCRCNVVKTMAKRKVLPRKILDECLYDSNTKIRAFASSRFNKN